MENNSVPPLPCVPLFLHLDDTIFTHAKGAQMNIDSALTEFRQWQSVRSHAGGPGSALVSPIEGSGGT